MEIQDPPSPPQRSVRDAFRRARKQTGLDPDDWAIQLSALVGRELNEDDIMAIEAGSEAPLADLLLAAADCSGVPLSALIKDRAWHQLVKEVRELRRAQASPGQAAG